ncbi:MAG: hypothetical protein GY769_20085 [bacterium]|nr:hypothetical protein [bacterium]
MKYVILILTLAGCGAAHPIEDASTDASVDTFVDDAVVDAEPDAVPDTTPDTTQPDTTPGPDTAPPPTIDVADACARLQTVYDEHALDCDHFCPWEGRPGPCDLAAVEACVVAIIYAAEMDDCAEYTYRLANDIICDETACN